MVYTKPWNPFIATRTFLLLVKWHNHRCKLNTSCSLSVKKTFIKTDLFFTSCHNTRISIFKILFCFVPSPPSNDINSPRKNGNVEFVKCPWKNPFFPIAKDKCLSWLDVFWLSAEHLSSYSSTSFVLDTSFISYDFYTLYLLEWVLKSIRSIPTLSYKKYEVMSFL